MTDTVDQRRRQLHAPVAAPFTPEQEARVLEIIGGRKPKTYTGITAAAWKAIEVETRQDERGVECA